MIGTAFLASPKSFAHNYHKERIVTATSQETLITDVSYQLADRRPCSRAAEQHAQGPRGNPFGPKSVIGEEEGRPIYLFSTNSPFAL